MSDLEYSSVTEIILYENRVTGKIFGNFWWLGTVESGGSLVFTAFF